MRINAYDAETHAPVVCEFPFGRMTRFTLRSLYRAHRCYPNGKRAWKGSTVSGIDAARDAVADAVIAITAFKIDGYNDWRERMAGMMVSVNRDQYDALFPDGYPDESDAPYPMPNASPYL